MLEVEGLDVAYGQRRALEGVSLTVGPGEIVTLLGANGSGKSTTLRAISGLVRPRAGRIRWEGRDLAHVPADAIVAAGIGHVPEGRDIFLELVARADAVIENNAARVMTQLGLGYDDLAKVNPRLVMCSMSGYGATGPERNYSAFGSNIETSSGLASILGYDDRQFFGTGTF